MKVCILGPIITQSYYGGVATFNEGLAGGLSSLGIDALVCTEQSDAYEADRTYRVCVIKRTSFSAVMQKERPDILIASLSYGSYLLGDGIPEQCITVYYLHGFFDDAYYPIWKVVGGSLFQRHICAKCDIVVANSSFTAQVNNRRWGISVDAVISPGISDGYIHPDAGSRQISDSKHVLYLGRLHKAKHIDVLLKAFEYVRRDSPETSFCIAGDGPHALELKMLDAELGCNVAFLGRVTGEDAKSLYARSDIFVSLNDREPFGIAFCEALASGCRIVCPESGGQLEYLLNHRDRTTLCEQIKPDQVAKAILRHLADKKALPPITDIDWFSYERVARDFLSLVQKQAALR